MSKSVETASNEGQDEPENDSVFDFLYHDPRRIGSFLAQFDENGLLTGISQNEGLTRNAKRGWRVGGGANVPLIGGGNVDLELSPGEGASESFERSYDPLWANAREFLSAIEDREMINENIADASLGDLVLAQGRMLLVDTKLLRTLYSKDALREKAVRVAMHNATEAGQEFNLEDALIDLDALTSIDPQVQLHFLTEKAWIWSTLRPDGLITPASELGMNHGVAVDGTWHILGIKDADPEYSDDQLAGRDQIFATRLKSKPFLNEAVNINSTLRRTIGRPVDCYGLLPLMIFRKIA